MHIYLPDAQLKELCTIESFDDKPTRRHGPRLWLSLPHGESFPLYCTVRASEQLSQFIRENSIYGDEPDLDRSHYLEVVFRDDGTALVVLKYQQILGSRWLCTVPQDTVRAFVTAGVVQS